MRQRAAFGGALASIALGSVACSAEDGPSDGAVRGTLVAYIAKMEDGTSRNEYRLFVDGDERRARELVFENPPELESGSEIEVWADERDGALVVRHFESRGAESAGGLGRAEQAIIDGAPYETRQLAYVLVDIGGGNGNYSEAQARIDVFGTASGNASLKQWLLENSYGRQDIAGEVVTGLSFDMTGCVPGPGFSAL